MGALRRGVAPLRSGLLALALLLGWLLRWLLHRLTLPDPLYGARWVIAQPAVFVIGERSCRRNAVDRPELALGFP